MSFISKLVVLAVWVWLITSGLFHSIGISQDVFWTMLIKCVRDLFFVALFSIIFIKFKEFIIRVHMIGAALYILCLLGVRSYCAMSSCGNWKAYKALQNSNDMSAPLAIIIAIILVLIFLYHGNGSKTEARSDD